MEKYPKLFIKSSIIYLFLGVSIGLYITLFPVAGISPVFIHVHLNLFGFVCLIIFGIAYHVLPRFNAKPIKYPPLIAVNYYLSNIGITGMVLSYLMGGAWGHSVWAYIYQGSAIAATTSIYLFVYNMFPVLANSVPEQVNEEDRDDNKVTGDEKVGEILEKWPDVFSLFTGSGFLTLENPAALAGMKTLNLKQACKLHNVAFDPFVESLNQFISKKDDSSASSAQEPPVPAASDAQGTTINRGELCTGETFIGDLLRVYPEAKKVVEKNYGAGCFSCPGISTETLSQSAMMHGKELSVILQEINKEIEQTF